MQGRHADQGNRQTDLSVCPRLYSSRRVLPGRRMSISDGKSDVKEGGPMKDDLSVALALTEVKAELFKSMGHPARIQVLEMLADGPVAVSRLRGATGLEPSNLSQHLGVLRRQRLIVPSRQDGRLFYELSCPEVSNLLRAARSLLGAVLQTSRSTLMPVDDATREAAVH